MIIGNDFDMVTLPNSNTWIHGSQINFNCRSSLSSHSVKSSIIVQIGTHIKIQSFSAKVSHLQKGKNPEEVKAFFFLCRSFCSVHLASFTIFTRFIWQFLLVIGYFNLDLLSCTSLLFSSINCSSTHKPNLLVNIWNQNQILESIKKRPKQIKK